MWRPFQEWGPVTVICFVKKKAPFLYWDPVSAHWWFRCLCGPAPNEVVAATPGCVLDPFC